MVSVNVEAKKTVDEMIAKAIIKEIKDRIRFLTSVGLEYLTLSRSSGTLSGGESQRIRLATQIGSSLMYTSFEKGYSNNNWYNCSN